VQDHKSLLQNLYSLVSNEYLCIPEAMEKVIISLKSAVANEYSLHKTQSSYNDTLDALRLACRPFHFLISEFYFNKLKTLIINQQANECLLMGSRKFKWLNGS